MLNFLIAILFSATVYVQPYTESLLEKDFGFLPREDRKQNVLLGRLPGIEYYGVEVYDKRNNRTIKTLTSCNMYKDECNLRYFEIHDNDKKYVLFSTSETFL